jgi:hypothetical protein
LLSLEAEDFMGYKYFRVDFDDTNIISLKGYNSAGKTSVLRAFGVINFDKWANKQSRFIRYGQNMFRITENFSDGVKIVREKYISGKSAYFMYKDGVEVFSTIQNGVYTPVKGVPETIKRYLGLIEDSKLNLHFRRGRDDLLLIDTTGRENYEFLSTVLKAEELTNATAMLKTDRLSVKSDISQIEYEIEGYRNLVTKDRVVTLSLVECLEGMDQVLSNNEKKKEQLDRLIRGMEEYSQIRPSVRLNKISTAGVSMLQSIIKTMQDYNNIKTTTSLQKVNIDRLQMLNQVIKGIGEYNSRKPLPTLNSVDVTRVKRLQEIANLYQSLATIEQTIESNKNKVNEYMQQVNDIEKWLKEQGIQVFRCRKCGELQPISHAC